MNDTFEFTLNSPLTEEQWDMITDVDMERTDSVTFHTKHGKEVEFAKVRHGKWIYGEGKSGNDGYYCTNCLEHIKWNYKNESIDFIQKYNYCPYCGAKIDWKEEE